MLERTDVVALARSTEQRCAQLLEQDVDIRVLAAYAAELGNPPKAWVDGLLYKGSQDAGVLEGFLEGSAMANTFNMLRSNDLIWSFVINNYLMGRDPFPFDLLHWNCDSTRMPAKMHSFYLRNMYMKNALRTPGGITLAGTPVDVGKAPRPVPLRQEPLLHAATRNPKRPRPAHHAPTRTDHPARPAEPARIDLDAPLPPK